MKKALISIATLLLLASVTFLFINATGSDKDRKNKKAATEVKKGAGKCEMQGTCKMVADKKSSCDPEKCKEMNCEKKDAKCDPANCPKHEEATAAATMKWCCGAKTAASCPKMEKQAQ